jgi:hypothetical protein
MKTPCDLHVDDRSKVFFILIERFSSHLNIYNATILILVLVNDIVYTRFIEV